MFLVSSMTLILWNAIIFRIYCSPLPFTKPYKCASKDYVVHAWMHKKQVKIGHNIFTSFLNESSTTVEFPNRGSVCMCITWSMQAPSWGCVGKCITNVWRTGYIKYEWGGTHGMIKKRLTKNTRQKRLRNTTVKHWSSMLLLSSEWPHWSGSVRWRWSVVGSILTAPASAAWDMAKTPKSPESE